MPLLLSIWRKRKAGSCSYAIISAEMPLKKGLFLYMKTKRVTVGAVFAGILIIVGMAAAFTTSVRKDNAKMVFMQKKVYIATGEDVSAQVEAEAGISEFDSPYIGEIMSTVAASKQPGEELQSNFGHVGAQIV